MPEFQSQTRSTPALCGGAALGSYVAFAAGNLILSARFLTSSSQSLVFANQLKPALAVGLVAGLALGARALLNPALARRTLSSPLVAVFLLAGFVALNHLLYPLLDREALKLAGAGSDADDALIDAATRWLSGAAPYAAPTYRGNPISPGIGWVLLNAPLASHRLFFLLTPAYLGALGLVLRVATGRWLATNVVILAHLSCVGFWEMAPTQDLAAAGLALCAAFVLAYVARDTTVGLSVVALLTGVVATARVPLIGFPALTALLLWPTSRAASAVIGVVGTAVAAGLHVMMLVSEGPYPPLHLLAKAGSLLGPVGIVAAAAVTIGIAAWAMARPAVSLAGLVARCAGCLAAPLGLAAAAQLVSIDFAVGGWEGANYLAPVFTFVAAALALHVNAATHDSVADPAQR